MMTIAVYRIDGRTGERRTVRERRTVEGEPVCGQGPDERFPPCRCRRSPACARTESAVKL